MQNKVAVVSAEVQEAAEAGAKQVAVADPKALKVCIMTADFWGLKSAGGTATAYHLLAAVLAKSKDIHVSTSTCSRIELYVRLMACALEYDHDPRYCLAVSTMRARGHAVDCYPSRVESQHP